MRPIHRWLLVLAWGLILAAPALADADGLTLLRALTGRWQGELQYRDYRDDSRQSIPMTVVHEPIGGGDYLLRRITFTDPGRQVHAVEVLTIDRDQATLVISHFRDRKHSVEQYSIEEQQVTDPEHWTLVLVASGDDDDRMAVIRLTQTRDGDRLTSLKEVQYLAGEGRGEWQYRNSVELRQIGP